MADAYEIREFPMWVDGKVHIVRLPIEKTSGVRRNMNPERDSNGDSLHDEELENADDIFSIEQDDDDLFSMVLTEDSQDSGLDALLEWDEGAANYDDLMDDEEHDDATLHLEMDVVFEVPTYQEEEADLEADVVDSVSDQSTDVYPISREVQTPYHRRQLEPEAVLPLDDFDEMEFFGETTSGVSDQGRVFKDRINPGARILSHPKSDVPTVISLDELKAESKVDDVAPSGNVESEFLSNDSPATDTGHKGSKRTGKDKLKLAGLGGMVLIVLVVMFSAVRTELGAHSSTQSTTVVTRPPTTVLASSSFVKFCNYARQYPQMTLTVSTPPSTVQQYFQTATTITTEMKNVASAKTVGLAVNLQTNLEAMSQILQNAKWQLSNVPSASLSELQADATTLNQAIQSLNTFTKSC